MSTAFTGTIFNSLKETLNEVVDDDTDNFKDSVDYRAWCKEKRMKDHWEDDLTMAGPGLASEKPEGTEIPTGTIREHYIKRYMARTYGLRLIITEEAMEDKKYEEAINLARRLKRAMYKTTDIDCTSMLVRGYDTNYPGGDGQPLWSSSHPLAHGGSWSNVMATPMSPSMIAATIATTQIRTFPGHDGITEGYTPYCVLCPIDQWAVWATLIESKMNPKAGNFAEINVIKSEGLFPGGVKPLKFWNNTSTNWAIVTDAEGGFNLRWRRKPENRTWVENSQTLAQYAITARWDKGWTDPRCTLGVQA